MLGLPPQEADVFANALQKIISSMNIQEIY